MVVKLYISTVSGNKEIKKKQEFLLNMLKGKHIEFEEIDITDKTKEKEKIFMRENCDAKGKAVPLPPQIFNDTEYCGDYDDFYEAIEDEMMMEFLKLAPPREVSQATINVSQVSDNVLQDNTNAQKDLSSRNDTFVTKGFVKVTNGCQNTENGDGGSQTSQVVQEED